MEPVHSSELLGSQTGLMSSVMGSNLYTMGIASRIDPRQNVPEHITIPPMVVRVLRVQLLIEEALETAKALGVLVKPREITEGCFLKKGDFVFSPSNIPDTELNLAEIIDGCCDTIYVAVGTMVSCGVLDQQHLEEVCKRNDAKFPNGQGIADADGKYQKPEGWTGPDHDTILASQNWNLKRQSEMIIAERAKPTA